MKTINKVNATINVQEWTSSERVEKPVMRNGKPTKRMKVEYVPVYTTIEAQGYEINGHVVYIPESDIVNNGVDKFFKGLARVYRENGERLTGACVYGHTGKVEHERCIFLSIEDNEFCMPGEGYHGACGKGSRVFMGRINW